MTTIDLWGFHMNLAPLGAQEQRRFVLRSTITISESMIGNGELKASI